MAKPLKEAGKERIYFLAPLILQAPIYAFVFLLFKAFCELKTAGIENVKLLEGKGVIFAANHSSEWDGILIRVALPFFSRFGPMYYVSLEKEAYGFSGWRRVIYGGTAFKCVGAYPARKGSENYGIALDSHIRILKKGGAVCIFPEGRRNKDGDEVQARGGVSYLAYATRAPIIPVLVEGLKKSGIGEILSGKVKASVSFGKPIDIMDILERKKSPSLKGYRDAAALIMSEIGKMKNTPI